jgi:hypothetical protein
MSDQLPPRNSGSKPGRNHTANVVHAHGPDLDTRPDGQRNAVAHDVKPTRPLLRARIVKGRKSTQKKLKNIIFSSKKTWPPETKPE